MAVLAYRPLNSVRGRVAGERLRVWVRSGSVPKVRTERIGTVEAMVAGPAP